MEYSQSEMKKAVDSGYWDLFRYNPIDNKLTLDSFEPNISYEEFISGETRFSSLAKANPERAKILFEKGKKDAKERRKLLLTLTNTNI